MIHRFTEAELAQHDAQVAAKALRETADHYRTLGDGLAICAGHVVAELDVRADRIGGSCG